MTTLVQVDLRSGDRMLTCWVEPKVRVGDRITLKDTEEPGRGWDVLRVGERRESTDIKRGWNFDHRRGSRKDA
jgi:hypothetical protein